jgi:hypothetical protein
VIQGSDGYRLLVLVALPSQMPFKDVASSLCLSAFSGNAVIEYALLDTVTQSLSAPNIMAMFKFFHGLGFIDVAEPFRVPVAKVHWGKLISILNRVCISSGGLLASNFACRPLQSFADSFR